MDLSQKFYVKLIVLVMSLQCKTKLGKLEKTSSNNNDKTTTTIKLHVVFSLGNACMAIKSNHVYMLCHPKIFACGGKNQNINTLKKKSNLLYKIGKKSPK